jgi:hypothetical protein
MVMLRSSPNTSRIPVFVLKIAPISSISSGVDSRSSRVNVASARLLGLAAAGADGLAAALVGFAAAGAAGAAVLAGRVGVATEPAPGAAIVPLSAAVPAATGLLAGRVAVAPMGAPAAGVAAGGVDVGLGDEAWVQAAIKTASAAPATSPARAGCSRARVTVSSGSQADYSQPVQGACRWSRRRRTTAPREVDDG